jgi:hypothetical protein
MRIPGYGKTFPQFLALLAILVSALSAGSPVAMMNFRPRVAGSLLWSLTATYMLVFPHLSLSCLACRRPVRRQSGAHQ